MRWHFNSLTGRSALLTSTGCSRIGERHSLRYSMQSLPRKENKQKEWCRDCCADVAVISSGRCSRYKFRTNPLSSIIYLLTIKSPHLSLQPSDYLSALIFLHPLLGFLPFSISFSLLVFWVPVGAISTVHRERLISVYNSLVFWPIIYPYSDA